MKLSQYFHANVDTFDKFQKGILDYAVANTPAMGIDPHTINNLHTLSATWQDAYQKCKNVGTVSRQDQEAQTQARQAYAAVLKPFIFGLYINEKVTPVDLTAMNLPLQLRTAGVKKILNILESPDLSVQTSKGGGIRFICKNGSGKASKPEGAIALQIRYFIGANPPADAASYTNVISFTKCRGSFTVDRNAALQPVYFVACWVGRNNETTVYSSVETGFVLP